MPPQRVDHRAGEAVAVVIDRYDRYPPLPSFVIYPRWGPLCRDRLVEGISLRELAVEARREEDEAYAHVEDGARRIIWPRISLA